MDLRTLLLLSLTWLALSTPGWAWSPFASEDHEEVKLSAAELGKVSIQAGWAKDNDHVLLFEVSNGLKGPIQCAGAQVDLKDGKSVGKSFMPKLFVPPTSSRNASLPGVHKGTMKAYAVECTCFKKQGRGECVNPLRK
jgi:hypothetical protein